MTHRRIKIKRFILLKFSLKKSNRKRAFTVKPAFQKKKKIKQVIKISIKFGIDSKKILQNKQKFTFEQSLL